MIANGRAVGSLSGSEVSVGTASGVFQISMKSAPTEPPSIELIIHNKIDLVATPVAATTGDSELSISASTGAGVDRLIDELHRRAGMHGADAGVFSARTRHVEALQTARARLDAAAQRLRERQLPELAAEELKDALTALGEIIGEFSSEDLLGRIFSNFCIGK